jgi:hypothetical protein
MSAFTSFPSNVLPSCKVTSICSTIDVVCNRCYEFPCSYIE